MNYSNLIKHTFHKLIDEYHLSIITERRGVYTLLGKEWSISIMIDERSKELTVFFKQSAGNLVQPIYKLFQRAGSPEVVVDPVDDKLTRNLAWHAAFIEDYVLKQHPGTHGKVDEEALEKLKSILAEYFMNYKYPVAVQKIRLAGIKGDDKVWSQIAELVLNRKFSKGGVQRLLSYYGNLVLYVNSDEEAFRWLDLMIYNIFRADNFPLIHYRGPGLTGESK